MHGFMRAKGNIVVNTAFKELQTLPQVDNYVPETFVVVSTN